MDPALLDGEENGRSPAVGTTVENVGSLRKSRKVNT
jgi:hypothetical protein